MAGCKYFLPCGRCDKYDRVCDVIQYEVNKLDAKPNDNYPFSSDCYPDNMAVLNDLSLLQGKISLTSDTTLKT